MSETASKTTPLPPVPNGPATSGSYRRWPIVVGILLAFLLVVVAALWTAQRGRVLPNTSIAGVAVGGMTAEEAAAAIADVARGREQDPITLRFEEQEFILSPTGDLGFVVDDRASIDAALARGRSNPFVDIPVRIGALWRNHDVALVEEVDADRVEAAVAAIAEEVDRDAFTGVVTVDPATLAVTAQAPFGTAEVRRDDTVDAVLSALVVDGPVALDLPTDVADPPISPADVDAAAEQLETAIAAPLDLRVDSATLTVDRAQLAELIEVVESADGTALELVVDEERVEELLGDAARERFDQTPVSASYETSRTPPRSFDAMGNTTWNPVEAEVSIVDGRDGRAFDAALAAEQLTEGVRDGVRSLTLSLATTEPELSNARAAELRPTHLLGTFTTYYTAGQARNRNIQRLADVIDDTLVLPGEQFSVNAISGERSCAKGYVPAGTIVAGELVDTCGGGVSQFGTTSFNAAFFSGVQLDQWQAHSFYISRYPRGREATLSYPVLDVKFTNTTRGAIVVRASYTASSVTVSLYGQPRATAVSASHGQPTSFTQPTTTFRNDPTIPTGETRTIQSAGSQGFRITVTRRVELIGGGSEQDTINTTYRPQNAIVARGTGPARPAPPPPPPSPPADTDDDDDD